MASIHIDSELMTNYVSALPVPAGSHFVTCLDPLSRRPMVFAISNDPIPKLQVVKEDADGVTQLVNFGPLLNLPSQRSVLAFDCQQSADLTIYLCLAVGDSTRADIVVVKPFKWLGTDPGVSTLPAHSVEGVHDIYVGSPDTGHAYPPILVTHQPKDRITPGSDITHILVDPYLSSWQAFRDLSLPVNATKVLDIAPAANAYGRGLYTLCVVGGQTQLIGEFARYDTDQNDGSLFWFNTTVWCPSGATRIATITDTRGRSCLLVGASDGLYYYTCSQATDKSKQGTRISTHALFQNPSTLRTTQDKDQVAVWSVSGQGELGYIRAASTQLSTATPVRVLPPGSTSAFSASVSLPPTGPVAQTLVVNDNSGNLTVLQQYTDTGLWRSRPFFYASTAQNVKIDSYNISLQVTTPQGNPVSLGSIGISSSAQIDAIVNGGPMTISTDMKSYKLDTSGDIFIIVPTASIAAQKLTISNLKDKDGKDLGLQATALDPSVKVIDNLSTVKQASDLTPWLDGVQVDPNDLAAAATAISQMHDLSLSLRKGPATVVASAHDTLGDAWHWAKQKVSDAVNWGIKFIDNVAHFVCTIAGQACQFVLDTLEKIGEGLTWVWNKIKLGFEKIKQYLGFLFSWTDILNTKDTIKNMVNSLFDYGVDKIDSLGPKIDGIFDTMTTSVKKSQSASVGTSTTSSDGKSGDSIMSSTKIKWVTDRLKNGGSVSGSNVTLDPKISDPAAGDGDLHGAVNQLAGAGDPNDPDINSVKEKIYDAFTSTNIANPMDTLKNIAFNTCLKMISGLKIAANAIISVLAKLLRFLQDVGNFKIDVPIFSPIYREFTGSDLTMFDALSLLVAIPMTIVTKLVTGATPPAVKTKFNPNAIAFLFNYNSLRLTRGFTGAFQSQPQAQPQTASPMVASKQGGPTPQMKLAASPSNQQASGPTANGTTATSGDTSQVDLPTVASGITKAANNEPLTADENSMMQLLLEMEAIDEAWEDIVREIGYLVNILPTIVTGIQVSISLLVPVFNTVMFIKGLIMSPEEALLTMVPNPWGRYAGIFFPALGAIATFIFPHPEMPGLVPRLLSSCNTLGGAFFLTIYSAIGKMALDSKSEDMYQFLNLMVQTLGFVCYSVTWDDELKAVSWKDHDQDCSGLGVSASTFTVLSQMAGFVTWELLHKGEAEFAVIALGVQDACGILSGIMQIVRYALQVDRKYVATYSRS